MKAAVELMMLMEQEEVTVVVVVAMMELFEVVAKHRLIVAEVAVVDAAEEVLAMCFE